MYYYIYLPETPSGANTVMPQVVKINVNMSHAAIMLQEA